MSKKSIVRKRNRRNLISLFKILAKADPASSAFSGQSSIQNTIRPSAGNYIPSSQNSAAGLTKSRSHMTLNNQKMSFDYAAVPS